MNNVQFHLKLVRYARTLLPVSEIHVELTPFDTQKMDNADITGIEYQEGPQKGHENVKAYVKWRDGYKCRVCGEKSGLQVHHIESRKTGGNAPNNLVTLCEECHRKVHAGMDIKLRRAPSKRDAAKMNLVKDRIFEGVTKENQDVRVYRTYGYITSYKRMKYSKPKSHASDAMVISKHPKAYPLDDVLELRQVRRHNRQIHKAKILKGGRRKLNQLPYTVKGFRLWDTVRYDGGLWLIKGRRATGYFSLISLDGGVTLDSVMCSKLCLVGIANRLIVLRKVK